MKWTLNPPTEPGFYWTRHGTGPRWVVEIVRGAEQGILYAQERWSTGSAVKRLGQLVNRQWSDEPVPVPEE